MNSINIKTPLTKYKVNELITKRWSARSFSDKQISEDVLMSLFEAASWSASSMNEQPWEYLYAYKGSSSFQKMWDCLLEGNKSWSKNASVLIISLTRKYFASNRQPNRHAMHDVGSANTTLLLQAAAHDIYGHMMGGFDYEKSKETFKISDDYEIACFICLGYLDDAEKLPEPFKTRELTERKRKSISEFTRLI